LSRRFATSRRSYNAPPAVALVVGVHAARRPNAL